MRKSVLAVLFLTAVLPLAYPDAVSAAAPPPTQPSPLPTPGSVRATLPKQAAPIPQAVPAIAPPASSAPSVAPGGEAITVTHFAITGNTVFDTATLESQISQYQGQALTLAELYKVANLLTRFYQDHGYGLARVTVPEQKFEAGRVELLVIEGRIGQVHVEGNTDTHTAVILHSAAAAQPGAVFTNRAAERAVLLVNDLPGVQAKGVLVPGSSFGTTDLVLNVQEIPYQARGSIDDYGRPATGRWRVNASASINSLTGHGDQLTAGITHAAGNLLNFGNLAYVVPAGPSGGSLALGYDRAIYHVGSGAFSKLDIGGASSDASVIYQYPLLRTTDQNLFWGLGVTHTSSYSDAGAQRISDGSINLLQASVYYTRAHQDGSYYTLNGQFFTNGKYNDGSLNKAGIANSNGEKARLMLGGSYVMPFQSRWRFIAMGGMQWSPDPLVDNDKYSLGGPYSVRGFLSAEQRGDSGLYASAEVQRNLWPAMGMSLGAFLDSGRVWDQSTAAVPGHSLTLSSTGLDLTVIPANSRWSARIQWAYAIGGYRPSDGNNGGHVWATLAASF